MSVEFTAEQQHAIEWRQGSLFLHAGAGSGKTSVLVGRFVRAVREDEVAVDRILAITFTDKAAAELKHRIRARFLELGERERAREAEGAWISTIHGFCSRLLRTHPLAAGIDPEYRVLEEPEAERIGVDAFEGALEEFLDRCPPGDAAARLDLLAGYTPGKLERMVRTVHSRLRSRGERRPSLPQLSGEPPSGEPEAAELESALRAAVAGLAGATGATARREREKMTAALAALAARGGELGDPDEFVKLEPKAGGSGLLRTPAFERLVEAHAAYRRACLAVRERRDYGLLRVLLRLYDERFARIKEERSGLDFEDLQLLARDLLAGDPALRQRYRERFEHVMVDEFQDTNRLQTEILVLLERDNLFTVGDANQSIYSFRNADVGLFREHQQAAAERGQAARIGQNFRSRGELLDVLNKVFENAFEDGFEPLCEPDGARRGQAPAGPSVELLVVDRGRWGEAFPDGERPFGPGSAPLWRAAEARLLARRVRELAGPGGPFAPGDVALLVRAGTDIALYERAIADQGLPTYVAGGGGYWSQQQVADLRAYLSALANPLDELALYSLLASPLVGASLDALGLIGLRAQRLRRDPWWVLREAFPGGGDGSVALADALAADDHRRLAAFAARFVSERAEAPRLSLETLIDRAVTQSGYDRVVLRMPDGERRMANVRKLMRLAREYEAAEGRDLRGFIDFVAEQDLLRAREGEAPLEIEGIEAVRLMTIHAAKGLEFPLVCVADLGRTAHKDDDALRVTDDGRVGLSVMSLAGGASKGMALAEIEEEQARLADQEERRIFYVAMTRAREHLLLSGATDVERWPEPRRLGAPIDWIWRALAPELPQMCAAGEAVHLTPEGRDARVRCLVCSPAELELSLPRDSWAPGPAATSDGNGPAAVQPPLLAPVEAAGAPPLGRLSYSSLESYRRCGYRFYLERVARLREGTTELADAAGEPVPEGLDALLRGTVVHELLEQFDFSRPVAPSAGQVAALLAARGASYDDSDVEDICSLIDGFAGSELCTRLRAAGRVRRELDFAFTLRPHGASGASLLVNGVIDVYAREEEGSESALVVDYKSDPVAGLDLDATCREKYGTQRLIYALAALRAGSPRVEVVHCFLERPDEPVSAAFEATQLPRLDADLLELARGVIEGRFTPTDRPHRELCATCPGREALCSWPKERTLAPLAG